MPLCDYMILWKILIAVAQKLCSYKRNTWRRLVVEDGSFHSWLNQYCQVGRTQQDFCNTLHYMSSILSTDCVQYSPEKDLLPEKHKRLEFKSLCEDECAHLNQNSYPARRHKKSISNLDALTKIRSQNRSKCYFSFLYDPKLTDNKSVRYQGSYISDSGCVNEFSSRESLLCLYFRGRLRGSIDNWALFNSGSQFCRRCQQMLSCRHANGQQQSKMIPFQTHTKRTRARLVLLDSTVCSTKGQSYWFHL